jgi:polysaccharide export outer membrane protein
MSASLFLIALLAASEAVAAASVPRAAQLDDPVYRIGPEDVLQVAVWNNEPMSRTAPVRPDGRISLPLLNDVPAAGLTPVELREELLRLLSAYIPHPEVSVTVIEVRSFKVTVIGQVPKPDRYELRSAATVMDLLAMAGGFTEFASRSRVVVLRSAGGKTERIPFDYDKVKGGDPGQVNFQVRPGDIIVIP